MTREGELLLEAFGGIDIKYIAAWDDDINQLQTEDKEVEEVDTSGTFEQLPCDLSNIQNYSDTVKGPEKQ